MSRQLANLNLTEQPSGLDYLFINSSNKTLLDPHQNVFGLAFGILMSMTTIIGNLLVICAFIMDKKLQRYPNYFILNLSIADLLTGSLIPPYIFVIMNDSSSRFFCTIWLLFDYMAGSASVMCIVVISLDRFLLVKKGLKYISHQSVTKALAIMLTVWFIAFLNYAPAILIWEIISFDRNSSNQNTQCRVWFQDNLVYLTITACIEFFLPFISICLLNLAVYMNIKERSGSLIRSKPIKTESSSSSLYFLKSNNFKKESRTYDSSKMSIHLNRDKKAARSLFILVITFFICWVN